MKDINNITTVCSLIQTIKYNVDKVEDVEGYIENWLLYDTETAAAFYNVTEKEYIAHVYNAAREAIKNFK